MPLFQATLHNTPSIKEPLSLENLKTSAASFLPLNHLIFEVAKCGTTSLRYNLWKEFYDIGKIEDPPVKKVRNTELTPFDHPSYQELLLALERPEARFTTVVRNPYARILSCYLDKIVNGARPKQFLLANLGYETDREISFSEFVHHISQTSSRDMNKHWMPMTALNHPQYIPYAKIGTLESIKQDMPEILHILGHPKPVAQERHSRHATSASEKLKKYYNDELIDLVKNRYHEDFNLLGYSTDLSDSHEPPQLNSSLLKNPTQGTDPILIKLLKAQCEYDNKNYRRVSEILTPLLNDTDLPPVDAALLLAKTWKSLDENDKYLSMSKDAFIAEPESSLVLKNYASALSTNHRHNEAKEVAEEIINRFPGRHALLIHAALILRRSGEKAKSREIINQAKAMAPSIWPWYKRMLINFLSKL